MGQQKNILVIEDDEDVRQLIGTSITSTIPDADIVLDEFDNAEQALGEFHAKKYDLIITDFKLPGMDGFDLIRSIHEQAPKSICPIIFISGFFTELESAKNIEYFENLVFLDKPFDVNQLIMHVKMFLYSKELAKIS